MGYERSIKEAFDKISGEILKADEIFDNTKDAFKVRKQFHKDEIELYCCECDQKLNVSTSKYDRLHFKHGPKAKPCLLKDSNLSPEESDKIYTIYRMKESERHKELKNTIGERLSKIKGIKSINVDNKFIFDGDEKRKPDVYCKYFNNELVFEIQLSDLSLKYILNRYEFYKRNNIYLIWILDNFDIHGQSQTERDIKYLTEYENFFKLDEQTKDFRLICTYKYPFLTDNNKLLTKWLEKSISLNQIKFSNEYYQIYYFNFGQKKKIKEEEKIRVELKKEDDKKKEEELERKRNAIETTNWILNELRKLWRRQTFNYDLIKKTIEELDELELSTLNQSEAFKPKGNQPRIHYWFSIAKKEHLDFLEFMLDCKSIELNINERSTTNKSLLSTLFENQFLDNKMWLTQKILKRGYTFSFEDEPLISKLNYEAKQVQSTIILCYLANKLNDKALIDKLFEHSNLICTIESAKRKKIVGFGYKSNEWIAFANNAIHSYKEYWDYIEIAFKHFGIWDKLISLDKKGTFGKKLEKYYSEKPSQNFDCDRLFRVLYPDFN
jgi:competence CoiA-like predicted nuclease